MVQLCVCLLVFSEFGKTRFAEMLQTLPECDLNFHFVDPVDDCISAVKATDSEGAAQQNRLKSLLYIYQLAAQSAEHLGAMGRTVVTIDRSKSVEELSAIIVEALVNAKSSGPASK